MNNYYNITYCFFVHRIGSFDQLVLINGSKVLRTQGGACTVTVLQQFQCSVLVDLQEIIHKFVLYITLGLTLNHRRFVCCWVVFHNASVFGNFGNAHYYTMLHIKLTKCSQLGEKLLLNGSHFTVFFVKGGRCGFLPISGNSLSGVSHINYSTLVTNLGIRRCNDVFVPMSFVPIQ